MPDYWCHECGGRTSMMGHGDRHDVRSMKAVMRLKALGVGDYAAVELVGLYNIGELREAEISYPTKEILKRLGISDGEI